MRSTVLSWVIGALVLLPACHLFEEPTSVTIEGTVTDKYTHKPVAGVSIVTRRFRYGSYGVTIVDSITGTRSDANGHYNLFFDASGAGYYRVRTDLYRSNLYDLTAYTDPYNATDGLEVKPGSSQTLDFQVVPLIPTKVRVNLSKQGRHVLNVYLQADEQDGQGYFSTQQVVLDTVPAVQQILAQGLVYTVPNRTYILTAYRATNHCQSIYQCQATNVSFERFRRLIGYPDTAVIQIP